MTTYIEDHNFDDDSDELIDKENKEIYITWKGGIDTCLTLQLSFPLLDTCYDGLGECFDRVIDYIIDDNADDLTNESVKHLIAVLEDLKEKVIDEGIDYAEMKESK